MGSSFRLRHPGRWLAALLIASALTALLFLWPTAPLSSKPAGGLTSFRSDAELRRFLRRVRRQVVSHELTADGAAQPSFDVQEEPPSPEESGITNTQEAGVDEGGIVKVSGNILVILRRGRLFTVSLAGGQMRPVASIDAFPPGVSGQGDWYDEMLVSGDRVIVVGFSYERGGTEINRFRLSPEGRLRFEDAWHLKSNDYYSSRNYASRLIGNRLIFYTPLYLSWREDPFEALPGLRKWRAGLDRRAPFHPIATARQVFIAPTMRADARAQINALHAVTTCDLTAPELDCSAVAVLGPESRTFYVSPTGVYLWVSDWTARESRGGAPSAFLFRLPFGNERPSALAAAGAPIDQFSFREDAADGMINVLVRAESGGDAMGNPEANAGQVSLLRTPIASFGDGAQAAPASAYRRLPSPGGEAWYFHNRFVGDHILYGGGAYGTGRPGAVFVAPVRGGGAVRIPLDHAVDRIEALGRDALVVGGAPGSALGLSAIELQAGGAPRRGDVFTLPAAAEGETRSHGFFFRPSTPDGASGILGLPIARAADPAYARFFGSAAAMLFLRRDARRFAPAGELSADVRGTVDDGCRASCTDWYGNARPIFLGGRVFALLGYELVEGRLEDGRISEIGRVNFSPRAQPSARD